MNKLARRLVVTLAALIVAALLTAPSMASAQMREFSGRIDKVSKKKMIVDNRGIVSLDALRSQDCGYWEPADERPAADPQSGATAEVVSVALSLDDADKRLKITEIAATMAPPPISNSSTRSIGAKTNIK